MSAETQFSPERCGQGRAEGPLTSGFVSALGSRWGWGPLSPAPAPERPRGGSPRRGAWAWGHPLPTLCACTPGQGGSGQGVTLPGGGLAGLATGARLVEEEPADREAWPSGGSGEEGAEAGSVGQVGTHASILLGTLSPLALRDPATLPGHTPLPRVCAGPGSGGVGVQMAGQACLPSNTRRGRADCGL